MKKLFLTMGLAAISATGFGQTLNNKPLSELNAPYIEIVGTSKLLKPMEVTIYVDYGQISKINELKNGWVFDTNGKRMAFNGMLDVVNHFTQYGYVLDMAYPISSSSGLVYHYIMKKED